MCYVEEDYSHLNHAQMRLPIDMRIKGKGMKVVLGPSKQKGIPSIRQRVKVNNGDPNTSPLLHA